MITRTVRDNIYWYRDLKRVYINDLYKHILSLIIIIYPFSLHYSSYISVIIYVWHSAYRILVLVVVTYCCYARQKQKIFPFSDQRNGYNDEYRAFWRWSLLCSIKRSSWRRCTNARHVVMFRAVEWMGGWAGSGKDKKQVVPKNEFNRRNVRVEFSLNSDFWHTYSVWLMTSVRCKLTLRFA